MARPLRVEYPGALYHVMSRGNEKSTIFRTDPDRRTFLAILASIIRKESWLLHSFCLLGNHYHLLVETPLGRLSPGMHGLNSLYSQTFNRRHERRGHLFEGRFKAVLVEKESHLLELHRYIVLNPVRAGLCGIPQEWAWSSYRSTCGLARIPPWLDVSWTLAQFDAVDPVRSYVRYVESGIRNDRPPAVRSQLFVGGEQFAAAIARRVAERRVDDDIPRVQRNPCPPAIDDVCAAVAREWQLPVEALRRRHAGEPRLAAIFLSTKLTGLSARAVGAAFGVKRGRVGNVVVAIQKRAGPSLRGRLECVETFLKTGIGRDRSNL